MIALLRFVTGMSLLAGAIAASGACRADIPADLNRFQRTELTVAEDKTYVEVLTLENRVDGPGTIAALSATSFTFDPTDETLAVIEAWVLHPDGTRIEVPPANIFTRPSAAAQNSPGFVGTHTTTVEFPPLKVGSIVHSKFKHTITEPQVFGFNHTLALGLTSSSRVEVQIKAPAGLPLLFRQRGAFATTDTTEAGIRTIETRIDLGKTPSREEQMVAESDVGPAFVATTLASYEEIGAIYAARSAGKADPTPEIAALARQIVGTAQGKEAARAIYDWVAGHIRYVAVFLDPSDGFVPHDAATVVRNGFGDCKDHVVLMQALLAAVGIRAEPALVQWSNAMEPLPLWSPAAMNHAMVYLPDFDMYANPTNPFAGFGVLDDLLSDKQVIIASAAGELRRTPALTSASSTYRSSTLIGVAPDGTIQGSVDIQLSADIDPNARMMLQTSGSAADIARKSLLLTPEGGFGEVRATDTRALSHPLQVQGKWTSAHAIPISTPATYMTLPLGIDVRPDRDLRIYLTASGKRLFPFIVGPRDYRSVYRVTLPAGATVERLPPDVAIRNAAGHVTTHYEATANGVLATRAIVLEGNVYAPGDYPALAQLIYGFLADQRSVIVYRPGT